MITNQKPYSPATQCITVNFRKNHNYIPASEQPAIAAKHKYYRERQWLLEEGK